MKIYKYRLPFERVFKINIPKDAEILTVQQDHKDNSIQMWCKINPENDMEEREFFLITTGEDFDDAGLTYVGTYQYQRGAFVGHIFESK